jgi:RES domain-containing protein
MRSAILLVPSVVTGGVESNAILNQDHPEFPLIQASAPRDVAWDRRLLENRVST